MKIVINKPKQEAPILKSPQVQSKKIGEWGRVENSHSKDNTVDVILATGMYLKRIPVASKEWVLFNEDRKENKEIYHNSGERDLPPVGSRVFILMPSCSYDDCFVLPFSGFFSVTNQTKPYYGDDKESIKEKITPSGWHIIDDHVTGSHAAISPDRKTSLKIDYGDENPELQLNIFDNIKVDVIADNSCEVKVFDTELIIKNGEVSIKPKKTTIEVDGDASIKVTGKLNVESTEKTTVKAPNVQITGGQLQVDGTVAPSTGPLCALTHCLYNGAPHSGNIVEGT